MEVINDLKKKKPLQWQKCYPYGIEVTVLSVIIYKIKKGTRRNILVDVQEL